MQCPDGVTQIIFLLLDRVTCSPIIDASDTNINFLAPAGPGNFFSDQRHKRYKVLAAGACNFFDHWHERYK